MAVDQTVLLLSENNDVSLHDFQWKLGSYNTYIDSQGGYSRYPGEQSGVLTLTNAHYLYNRTNPYANAPLSLNGVPYGGINRIAYADGNFALKTTGVAMVENDMVAMAGVPGGPGAVGGSGSAPPSIQVRKNFEETWIFADIEE